MPGHACGGDIRRKGWANLDSHTLICLDRLIVLHIRKRVVKVVEQAAPFLVFGGAAKALGVVL